MNLDLAGKRALVCGASQGIGRAAAIELAALGASVTVCGRNAEALERVRATLPTKAGQTHLILVADFAKPDEVKSAAEQLVAAVGAFAILLNNTGGPPPGPAHAADVAAFLAAFNQHLVCNQHLVQTLLPGMREAG